MREKEIDILRPGEMVQRSDAVELVQLSCAFKSSLFIRSEQFQVSAKSFLGVIALQMVPGMPLTITAKGPDEGQALDAVCGWFQQTAPMEKVGY